MNCSVRVTFSVVLVEVAVVNLEMVEMVEMVDLVDTFTNRYRFVLSGHIALPRSGMIQFELFRYVNR